VHVTGVPQEKPQERGTDALAGMYWYNSLTRHERLEWHERARSAVPAECWAAWKAGRNSIV
jgi:hypothetical protein